jgi:hypothetical protein
MAPKPCLLCNDALATGRGAYVTMDTYGIYAPASSGRDPVLRIQTTAYVTLPRALFLPGEKRRVAGCSFLWMLRPPLKMLNLILNQVLKYIRP